jgi:hypothetical protein
LEEPWTLILDDALANSFVAPVTEDIKDDHQMTCKFWFLQISDHAAETQFIIVPMAKKKIIHLRTHLD